MKSRLFLTLMVCFMVFGLSSSAFAIFGIEEAIAKSWSARIDKLVAEKKFAEVAEQSRTFINWSKARGHKLDEYIVKTYDTFANAQSMQGYYQNSANTIRESNSWKSNSANVDKVMSYAQKDLSQSAYFTKTIAFHDQKIAMTRKIYDLTQTKQTLVNALLQAKDISKAELGKLQADLKAVDAKISDVRKELEGVNAAFLKDTEAFRKDNIIFQPKQLAEIMAKTTEAEGLNRKTFVVEVAVRNGLLAITEKYQYGWNGLEEKLTKTKDVQTKIMDLQKSIMAALDKKPLSDADKKVIVEMRKQIAGLADEQDKLLADIEKAFMDSSVFNKLSPAEQSKYMEIFKVLRDADKVIDSANVNIDAKIKVMSFKYGDLNGDGKIDKADATLMIQKFLLPRPWPFMFKPIWDKAADLDGNGVVNWADLALLNTAVSGDRKTFPVDPENMPGDLNGNGKLDEGDVEFLAKIMVNPGQYAKAFLNIADLNKDGKVDAKDIMELVQMLQNRTVVVPVATGTVILPVPPATFSIQLPTLATGTVILPVPLATVSIQLPTLATATVIPTATCSTGLIDVRPVDAVATAAGSMNNY